MSAILAIYASPRGAASHSERVGRMVVERLLRRSPDANLIIRRVGVEPPPHIDAAYAAAMETPEAHHAAADRQALTRSEEMIAELEATDRLVIATPMHNFTVPSTLKAWIDHVVRARRSFALTPRGKEGLLADRPTYVVVSAGGVVSGDGPRQPDFVTPYLQHVLSVLGIRDVRFHILESLVRGPEAVHAAERRARAWLDLQLPEE
ncbi:FMN-dependent NADH-azoreductase [Nannocystis exedens]|uniref:FMN dependent NADH:quinone oxidoreductase n=1 Tax=Nannocystis exedens TaxID=54 RepID=A0A1I2IWS1_9BACT|nr:NAD(P)H-dependent oxidoreductase [Nannocystis exedens]PCC68800.1 FMN-dependent NADH-azoreductase [Nannocystis exedens]SFF46734.1 FMN-dependent NADH-azoreductase [Nannocystis exedens]